MNKLFDIHTHPFAEQDQRTVSIVSTPNPAAASPPSTVYYSLELHPWNQTSLLTKEEIVRLINILTNPQIIAIGECGLDKLKGPSLEQQISILEQIITLSEETNKPLILHVVKCWNEILSIHRRFCPKQRWIIHGFRGNPILARQLIDQGFYLSLSNTFGKDTAAIIPSERLLIESDTRILPLAQIYGAVAQARHVDLFTLIQEIACNVKTVFGID